MFGFGVVMLGMSLWFLLFAVIFDNIHKSIERGLENRWKSVYHNEGDFWDGEELDERTGEIGSDLRPAGGYRPHVGRDYESIIKRFHDGGWQDA